MNALHEQLNHKDVECRLEALKDMRCLIDDRRLPLPERKGHTNNHVHTQYSFSPYSPTKAVFMGYQSGLSTIGIMDHDSISGAEEFIRAGEVMGIPTTIGFEMRTDWSRTKLKGKRINNPDQVTSAYIAAHGIPHSQINRVDTFLAPVREARNARNRRMIKRINDLMKPHGLSIDYKKDVMPLSKSSEGGSITERHLLFTLANKMLAIYPVGDDLVAFLEKSLDLKLSEKQKQHLTDRDNTIVAYDLLNILKSHFVQKIYLSTDLSETPPVDEAVRFIKSIGAVPSYCYLGDVGESPTGDKKAQKFEDDYLEDVLDTCRDIGFNAIAYMPSRNTKKQLERVIKLCNDYGFMQISGEDINQPRQSFLCEQLLEPMYQHLSDTTWALLGHEIASSENINNTLFAAEEKAGDGPIADKIHRYRDLAKQHYNIG